MKKLILIITLFLISSFLPAQNFRNYKIISNDTVIIVINLDYLNYYYKLYQHYNYLKNDTIFTYDSI